jgi:tight adherence protein C
MFRLFFGRAARPPQRGGIAPAARRGSVILLLALASLLLTPGAHAQTPTRSVHINQVRSSGWPTVTLNINLQSLDNTSLGDVRVEQFAVEENGVAQTVGELTAGTGETGPPLSVVLVVDTSGSMQGDKLRLAKEAGAAFIAALGPRDEVALLPFNTQIGPAVPFTTDKAAVASALDTLTAHDDTRLYDALYDAAALITKVPAKNRQAIVLLTDGKDTGSTRSSLISSEAARQAGALVYTISVGEDTDSAVLQALSEPTGGHYIAAGSAENLRKVYLDLAHELTGQFLLTYTSTTHTAKDYETIRIRLRYTLASGEVVTHEVRYRPPAAAIIPPTPAPRPAVTPVVSVPLPPGLALAQPPPAVPTPAAPPPAPGVPNAQALRLVASILAAMGVLVSFGGLVLATAPSAVRGRIDRFVAESVQASVPGAPAPNFSARVLYPFLDNLGRRLNALTPGSYLDQVQQLLYQAGPPYRLQRSSFVGLQVGVGVAAFLLAMVWAMFAARNEPLKWFLAGGAGLLVGLYLPYSMLSRRVRQRKKVLLRALPGALDFMVIMVEAGIGFDQALNELTRRWRNTLTDEFSLLLIDFQIGKPRRDAWRDLTTRTQLPELNAFVAAMLQSEQTGASVGGLLRVQAEQMRIRRRQRAEEEARMAPVKMLIPMGLFIFPCILIVILGPAVPQILGTLGNLGR